MIEDLGLSEKENGNFSSAISLLKQARSFYTKPHDILRTIVEEADTLIESGDKKAALALIRSAPRLRPDSPANALLRQMEEELEPARPRPTPSPKLPLSRAKDDNR